MKLTEQKVENTAECTPGQQEIHDTSPTRNATIKVQITSIKKDRIRQ